MNRAYCIDWFSHDKMLNKITGIKDLKFHYVMTFNDYLTNGDREKMHKNIIEIAKLNGFILDKTDRTDSGFWIIEFYI